MPSRGTATPLKRGTVLWDTRSAYILMMLGDKPYLPCHLKSSPCFSRANSGHRGVFTPVSGSALVLPFCLTLYTYLADVKMLTCITCTYLYIHNTLTFTHTYTTFFASCVRRGVFFLPRIVQVCMIQVVSEPIGSDTLYPIQF